MEFFPVKTREASIKNKRADISKYNILNVIIVKHNKVSRGEASLAPREKQNTNPVNITTAHVKVY